MNKEPIGLYIFRYVLGFALLGFMAMLYWSSVSIEEDIKNLDQQVGQFKNDFYEIRTEIDRVRDDLIDRLQKGPETTSLSPRPNLSKKENLEDPNLPNLLIDDPFYENTLPEMLGKSFEPNGDYRVATIGRPKNLNPFSNWNDVNSWRSFCVPTVGRGHFGKYETLAPSAAVKMEERVDPETGEPAFWVHLRNDLYWQPIKKKFLPENTNLSSEFFRPHRVTAYDFKFYFDAMMNPFLQEAGAVALRTYFADVESVKVIDEQTFVVKWKTKTFIIDGKEVKKPRYAAKLTTASMSPLPAHIYQYFSNGEKIVENDSDSDTYRANSLWAQNFGEHWARNIIVSAGPWTFDGWTDRYLTLKRNNRYYEPYAALMEEQKTLFKDNPDSSWQAFKVGNVDVANIRPDQIVEWKRFIDSPQYKAQVEAGNAINRIDYLVRSYTYIGWNGATPYFQSKKVRRAMTMAIDRERIINDILNGMGVQITGPFFIESPSYDKEIEPWPYDLAAAKILLEEEGWYDSNDDGVRDKFINGERVPFRFTLTYFVKNSITEAICDYIATSLKKIGVECNLNGVDIADLSSAFEDKSFDAICLGWALGTPPEDPRQLWESSGAKKKGSSNAVGFSNKEADAIINALDFEFDSEKRIALYHAFHRIIHEESPYTFLYTPKTVFLYREYIKNVFIPADRQDLVPGANVVEPQQSIFYIQKDA